jgi:hypothetical protein
MEETATNGASPAVPPMESAGVKLRGTTHEDHDQVTGRRVTFAAFPWRWTKGDGCIVRLVAIVDPGGEYRLETGEA